MNDENLYTNPASKPPCHGCAAYFLGGRWFFVARAQCGYLTNGMMFPRDALRVASAIEAEFALAQSQGSVPDEWRPRHHEAAWVIDGCFDSRDATWEVVIQSEKHIVEVRGGIPAEQLGHAPAGPRR